ncbi:MAG: pyridoxamine 5'-phosphate oxidase family protein [Ilumatobacteraceae bacterium]|jgi:general stress protein 26|nr:pyridoxamine 5'-phosphate oxidase family protein [Ilumatobacteraceae bacterium]
MASRRNQIEMTPAEVEQFLNGRYVMNIATNGPSGHPHLVAMWFSMIDGKPVFWTFGKAQKVLNIRRDARITALVETGEDYNELRGVELVGTARLVEDHADIVRIGALVAQKYSGDIAVGPEGMEFIGKQAHKRIGVVIDVEKTVTWDHTKLGGVY